MNQIRAIQALNKRELEAGITNPAASWHADYRDTAFVYIGGLPNELSEGDVTTIFSQYGEPVFLRLVRDRETGKSKGFGWLKYEDQRSTDLAVDNLGGAEIAGRILRVDHARYRLRDDEDPEEGRCGWEDVLRREGQGADCAVDGEDDDGEDDDEEREKKKRMRPALKEEKELRFLMEELGEEDPMKEFLVEEKNQEVKEARLRDENRNERKHGRHRRHENHVHHHQKSNCSRLADDDPVSYRDRAHRHKSDRPDNSRSRTPLKLDRRSKKNDEDRSGRDGDRRRRDVSRERDGKRDKYKTRDRDQDRDDRRRRHDDLGQRRR